MDFIETWTAHTRPSKNFSMHLSEWWQRWFDISPLLTWLSNMIHQERELHAWLWNTISQRGSFTVRNTSPCVLGLPPRGLRGGDGSHTWWKLPDLLDSVSGKVSQRVVRCGYAGRWFLAFWLHRPNVTWSQINLALIYSVGECGTALFEILQ